MKRCAIFFALLVLTLLIAVLTEQRTSARPLEEVTMDSSNAMAGQGVAPDSRITD
jgi:hypothetical protein